MKGIIFDIKEMAVHDGPGLRTTVFFKGCPLRCQWCHNPEGLIRAPQLLYRSASCVSCGQCRKACDHEICKDFDRCILACPENCLEIAGREVTALQLAEQLLPSAAVLGDSFGGFTFSGGEPLAQASFLLALVRELEGYHLCLETSGYARNSVFCQVVETMNMVIMDLKLADPILHKQYTGVDNGPILENFHWLQQSGKAHVIRTPLIPGITDTAENLQAIASLVGDSPWEQLPYNEMAGAKYKQLGMTYPLDMQEGVNY